MCYVISAVLFNAFLEVEPGFFASQNSIPNHLSDAKAKRALEIYMLNISLHGDPPP